MSSSKFSIWSKRLKSRHSHSSSVCHVCAWLRGVKEENNKLVWWKKRWWGRLGYFERRKKKTHDSDLLIHLGVEPSIWDVQGVLGVLLCWSNLLSGVMLQQSDSSTLLGTDFSFFSKISLFRTNASGLEYSKTLHFWTSFYTFLILNIKKTLFCLNLQWCKIIKIY